MKRMDAIYHSVWKCPLKMTDHPIQGEIDRRIII